ncbi:MAG: hypothetical protein HFH69_00595 [Lachnospiraceae bacterium]|nr:hypothetical protein [Lachnospiraceae bacterium]
MVTKYEKAIDFDSNTFESMKQDMNFILQRLLDTMQEKGATEGFMTLKIDIVLVKEFIPNYDPDVKGESREVSKPMFKHKATSTVKINDDKSGIFNNEMEMVMDEDTGCFKLIPIANTQQRTIFDSDFQQENKEDREEEDGQYIDGDWHPALPESADGENTGEAEGEVDSNLETNIEERGGESELGENLPDITDELLGEDNQTEDGEDYNYDDPTE